MFNFSNMLKKHNDSLDKKHKKARWNYRLKKYITTHKKILEFEKIKSDYWCNIYSAIDFIESENIDNSERASILNLLYKEQIKELQVQVNSIPDDINHKKQCSSDKTNFNLYDVDNIEDLGHKIVDEISENEKSLNEIFKDYVYCFTYFYKYNSIATNIATIRKVIRDSELSDEVKDEALKEFTLSGRIYDYLNEGGRKKRDSNMSMTANLENIEVPMLYDLVTKAKEVMTYKVTKHNKKFIFTYLSACISLAVGRRLTEIVYQSEFKKIADYKIKIIGLGKKRESEKVEITIPTLFLSADDVIRAVKIVRDIIPKGLRTQAQIEKFGHNLSDFKLIDIYYGATKYINTKITDENKKIVFTYLKDFLLMFTGREALEVIAHNRSASSYSQDEKNIIEKLKSIFPKDMSNPKDRKAYMKELYDSSLIKQLIKNNNAKYDNTRAMCALVAEKIYNHNTPNEESYKPQASYIQSILGHGDKDRNTYEYYYKRQVLLKNFDLKSYLLTAKSAML